MSRLGADGRRRAAARSAVVVLAGSLALTGCTVTFGGPDDATTSPGGSSTATGGTSSGGATGTTTIDDIERGEPMRWDVSRPITAESVGLGESQAVVQVPDGAAQVELTLPDGTWSTTAEELTIQPRRGYVSTINVFRTLSGGQAVHDQLVADADVLGFPRSQVDRWLDELPASLDASRAGGTRERTGINGSNGDVVTSVQISHEPGPGGDESIRLWYAISPVTPD
ncbi:hypothetical protein H1Q78_16700 [Cellulosimicrobium cellulans]|uniref:hypothetical protein n=1 Tax=Cellulosimicrobium cellulans TaxID=1710 RepID=UPI001EDB3A98|nr:hypothetical protein [Cellulosimicrobium cellulans]UKJ62217.1 hypothetical protein H1Q78_16700 [Cellulosimicrobium cellulans]